MTRTLDLVVGVAALARRVNLLADELAAGGQLGSIVQDAELAVFADRITILVMRVPGGLVLR